VLPLHRLRLNRKAAIYAIVLAIAAFLFHAAQNFDYDRIGNRIGPNAWPTMILILLMAVASCGLVKSLIGSAPQTPAQESEEAAFLRPPEIFPHLVWLGIAATLGYLVALPILGFFVSTVLFSGALIYLSQYRNMLHIAVLSVVFAPMFMVLFMRVVYVALPIGIEPFARVSLAIMSLIGVR
jgi:putative tricarboxylic transport membrane protein